MISTAGARKVEIKGRMSPLHNGSLNKLLASVERIMHQSAQLRGTQHRSMHEMCTQSTSWRHTPQKHMIQQKSDTENVRRAKILGCY